VVASVPNDRAQSELMLAQADDETTLYLSNIRLALGERRVSVGALASDPETAKRFESEGSRHARLARSSAAELALRCAHAALTDLEDLHTVERSRIGPVVVVTGDAALAATTGLGQLADALRVDPTTTFAISGHTCGNLGLSLRVVTGLVESQQFHFGAVILSNVFDKDGVRLIDFNMSLLSDGAAACIVSDIPLDPCFRILGLHAVSTVGMSGGRGDLDDVRSARIALDIARGMRSSVDKLLGAIADVNGLEPGDFDHVFVNNYGARTRRFFERCIGVKLSQAMDLGAAEFGHCHSVDPLLLLDLLAKENQLHAGDRILVLTDSIYRWEAILLEYARKRLSRRDPSPEDGE